MTDIVIYMSEEIYKRKTKQALEGGFYWDLHSKPKQKIESVYLATKGKVMGCYKYYSVSGRKLPNKKTYRIDIQGTYYYAIQDRNIKCKPFRGFKYRWWK